MWAFVHHSVWDWSAWLLQNCPKGFPWESISSKCGDIQSWKLFPAVPCCHCTCCCILRRRFSLVEQVFYLCNVKTDWADSFFTHYSSVSKSFSLVSTRIFSPNVLISSFLRLNCSNKLDKLTISSCSGGCSLNRSLISVREVVSVARWVRNPRLDNRSHFSSSPIVVHAETCGGYLCEIQQGSVWVLCSLPFRVPLSMFHSTTTSRTKVRIEWKASVQTMIQVNWWSTRGSTRTGHHSTRNVLKGETSTN